ncbi:unnamed protein product [Dicrocoelium dendriticum]|nr:unnamed protein product [Dicrocoelium dendriticum]
MTYGTRSQCRFSLSVRTRALLQKFHERALKHQRLFTWSCSEMRLRTRIIPAPSSANIKIPSLDTASTLSSVLDSYPNRELKLTGDPLHPNIVGAELSVAPNSSNNGSSSSIYSTDSTETTLISACKWEKCGALVHQSQLVSHIQQTHVLPQLVSNRRKCFICLWQGCRVFRLPSVSAGWLENHILHHTDAKGKPFRCIFDGCNMRFSTSILLERHVQRAHMPLSPKIALSPQHSTQVEHDASTSKVREVNDPSLKETDKHLISPNPSAKKNLRRRKRARGYRVRRVDFYDRRTQCVIHHRLRLCKMLCYGDTNNLTPKSHSNVSTNGDESALCAPLMRSPTKPTLRSSASITAKSPTPRISPDERRRHLALLLSNPHTFVGQRLSDDHHVEVLVRWLGTHGPCSLC